MTAQEILSRCSAAAEEFNEHEQRSDGVRVIESLCGGLSLLRDTLYARSHADVERRLGMDSMVFPLSEEKSERTAKREIEVYEVVVSAGAADEHDYVSDEAWFRDWLARLRLGHFDASNRVVLRMSYYAGKSARDRSLAFSDILATVLPEASRAPLILMRLFPLAVGIVTALAFEKSADAQQLRHEQLDILPCIADCSRCHGKPLENAEQCPMCGNPLWTYDWLTAADE